MYNMKTMMKGMKYIKKNKSPEQTITKTLNRDNILSRLRKNLYRLRNKWLNE
jgi:hypothetical protein